MERCTLCLIVEGACQYNPHIAQTVPHRFSPACLARASDRLWSSSIQYILCAVRPARSAQGRVCPCTTHKILSIMPSPGSCRSTSGKHRLLQYSRVSPGSIAQHDPEASCGSPDGRDGGEEEQTPPRIRQSVSTHIQLMRFSKPFSPHESRFLACVCRWIMASGPLDHAEQERRKSLPRLDMRA